MHLHHWNDWAGLATGLFLLFAIVWAAFWIWHDGRRRLHRTRAQFNADCHRDRIKNNEIAALITQAHAYQQRQESLRAQAEWEAQK